MATEEVAWPGAMAISKDERAFFIQFGARISNFRRQLSMTQTQLADDLGVSQQAVNAYEAGTRRVPVSMLPQLPTTLVVTIEELIGMSSPAGKRGPQPKSPATGRTHPAPAALATALRHADD